MAHVVRCANRIGREGDCLDLLQKVPDNFVKLVVTSPPYNLNKAYETKLDMDEYVEQQAKVIKECVRILDDDGSICWQVGNYVNNDMDESLIIDRTGNMANAYKVAKALGIKNQNVIQQLNKDYFLDVSIVIGRDYFNLAPFK